MDLAEGLRAGHRDWFVEWVQATPIDQRLWSMPWIHQCADELDNLHAAFDWSMDHNEVAPAVALLLSTAGALHCLLGSEQGYRCARRLLDGEFDADLDERDRVAVLAAGLTAAIGIGDHVNMEAWGAQAEQLIEFAEPCVAIFALCWRAAAAVIRAPDRAAALYAAAGDKAARAGSTLATGYVAAWRMAAELCTPDGRSARPSVAASDYGGTESLGWGCAVTMNYFHEARLGHRAEAEALLREVSQLESRRPLNTNSVRALISWEGSGDRAVILALAGDFDSTLLCARSVLHEVDRTSDVDWHAEMVLAVAIAYFRAGDLARALTYLEVLRRAPMMYPILYDFRRDFADQARNQLDDDVIAAATTLARALDVEAILDRELRT
jgi:hypothetical protein